MNKIFQLKNTIYIFIILFILLAFNAFITLQQFSKTKKYIVQDELKAHIAYTHKITSNLANLILEKTKDKSLIQALKDDKNLRINLEQSLQLFRTCRYRYIYVITKYKDKFRFLLDASKDDKAHFLEIFQPIDLQQWHKVYKTKKSNYFKNKDVKSLWLTFLQPIVKNNEVEAIIAVDFSLEEQNNIQNILNRLVKDVRAFTIIAIVMFITIILFLFFERKKITLLNTQAKKIKAFNDTLQKKVKEEVLKNRKKDKQMIEQARLAQMGEMLGMIAHQWRQPLSAISSVNITINLKAQQGQLDIQTVTELTNKIDKFTQHLSHTIDDFRNFFKSTKEKMDTTYTQIINSTLDIVKPSIENKNIQLITQLNSDVVFQTYPSELKQVLLNLIKNAEDVLVENNIQNPYIKITTNDNILTVCDNGGGIPSNIIDKIFDPYFSTKDLNGTGLGLYMSKTIIEEHCNGTLSVHNEKDGACFTITLPLS